MEDVFSRLSYTESLEGEKAVTTIGLCHRATVFFADEFLFPHTACGDQLLASRLHAGVGNVMTNYTWIR